MKPGTQHIIYLIVAMSPGLICYCIFCSSDNGAIKLYETKVWAVGCWKNFSKLYFSHFQIDWMLLLRYCFVIFHIDLNLGPDTPNKVTNQSNYWTNESLSMIATGLWLVTLLGVSAAGFCTMSEITKQYLKKIIHLPGIVWNIAHM